MDINQLPIRYDYYLHLADTWKQVLSQFDLASKKVILDYLSGWSPKIPLSLLSTDFTGTLTAVDCDEHALVVYQKLAGPLLKNFHLSTYQADTLIDSLPSCDLLIANHALEDLILFSKLGANPLSNPYQSIDNFRQTWTDLATSHPPLPTLAHQLASSFTECLGDNGILLISQYPSYQEKLYHITEPYTLSLELLNHLTSELAKFGYHPRPALSKKIISPIPKPYFSADHLHIFTH